MFFLFLASSLCTCVGLGCARGLLHFRRVPFLFLFLPFEVSLCQCVCVCVCVCAGGVCKGKQEREREDQNGLFEPAREAPSGGISFPLLLGGMAGGGVLLWLVITFLHHTYLTEYLEDMTLPRFCRCQRVKTGVCQSVLSTGRLHFLGFAVATCEDGCLSIGSINRSSSLTEAKWSV